MSKAIRWTDEEKSELVKKTAQLRRFRHEETLLYLFNEAQKDLPASRQRTTTSFIAIGTWFLPAFAEEMNKKEVVTVREEVETVLEIPQSLKTVSTPELLLELLTRFAGKLDQLERLIPTATATATLGTLLNKKEIAEKSVKPVVVVAGLLNNQFKFVEHHLGTSCKFAFVASDEGDTAPLPSKADRVYLVTKFASHSVQNRLRAQYNGQVSLVHGGLTTLVAQIAKDLHIPV
jgi:hypothetical protein